MLDVEKVLAEIKELCEVIRPLNNKNEIAVTSGHVKAFMKQITKGDHELFERIEQLSVMLYLVSVHQKMARVLVQEATTYANRIDMFDGTDKDFKKNPIMKTLFLILVESHGNFYT